MEKSAPWSAGEIAFIDPGVESLGDLLHAMRQEVEAIVLDPTAAAAGQIADALRGRDGVRAVHIIAHGSAGEVNFTAGRLSRETLGTHAAALGQIGAAMAGAGNLLLWSCETGQGRRGAAFVAALARAAGVPVAAATGLVGAAARGGKWLLDAGSHATFAQRPLTATGAAGYAGVLAPISWTGTTSTDWNTSTNWSGGVPGSGDDVTIGTTANSPTLTSTSTTILSLTINGSDTLTLAGTGTVLTVAGTAGVTLSSTGGITGVGKIAGKVAASGAANITASGGTLEVTGVITNSGGALTLTIAGASDKLLLDGFSAASSLTFGSSGTLEIGSSARLVLTTALAIGTGTVQLDGASSLLDVSNATSGITISTGTITGRGKIQAPAVTASGAAHITANGGTLEVTGTIADNGSAVVLTITGATDKLLLDGTSAAQTVTFGSSGTLELSASGGMLTVGTALAVGSGTVQLDEYLSSSLTDAAGITLTTGTITGAGQVTAAVTASGAAHITANGGELEMIGSITDSGSQLTLTVTGSTDVLALDGGGTYQAHTVSFNGSTGQLNLYGTLTVGTQMAIAAGTVYLEGGSTTLTDAAGVTISSGYIFGAGKVSAAVTASGAATIFASNGTLEMAGAITDSGGQLTLQIDFSSDTLLLDAASTAQTVTFLTNSGGTLELNTGGTLTVGTALALGARTLKLDGSSSTFTDASGISLGSGTKSGAITGIGTVAANLTQSGTGTANTITASGGGTLHLTGTVGSGLVLAISSAAANTLSIENTATSSGAITINSANQTLAIGSSGALTISTAESITNGTIALAGGSLTSTSALTVGSGATLRGFGTVATAIAGPGTVLATGGTLDITGNIVANATGLQIAAGASNVLQLDGDVNSGAVITFLGAAGTHGLLDITGAPATFFGTVALNVGSDALLADNDDIQFGSNTVISASLTDSTHLSVVTSGGTYTITLANAVNTGTTFADWSGTEVFLSTAACFARGTRILTPNGEVPVEELRIGNALTTLSGAARPVRWIGRRGYDGRFIAGNRAVLPIRIAAGALGDGVPARDLSVSPEHALHLGGALVPAALLVNGATIVQEERVDHIEYFNLELDSHDILIADGAPAESYVDCDNRFLFANAAEYAALYPDATTAPAQFCAARLEAWSPELAAIRALLAARADLPPEAADDAAGIRLLANPGMAGAAIGTLGAGGALPDGWQFYSAAGLSLAVGSRGCEDGIDYVDLRLFGTPTARTNHNQIFLAGRQALPVAPGQSWAVVARVALAAGSLANVRTVELGANLNDGAGAYASWFGAAGLRLGGEPLAARRLGRAGAITEPAAAYLVPLLQIAVNEDQPVDLTLRIGQPSAERVRSLPVGRRIAAAG